MIVALPIELAPEEHKYILSEFIKRECAAKGMCADVCYHDTDGHNPHAHIMLTVRPLTAKGTWQAKTQKEYLCIRRGVEKGFTAAEYKQAEKEGWDRETWEDELRITLSHELTHHMENLSGLHALDDRDAEELAAWREEFGLASSEE